MSVSENQFLMKNYVESDYFVQSVGGGVKPERVVRNEITMSGSILVNSHKLIWHYSKI